ncbi:MAG: WecB/TagA/CpsF family glycosyltransferase [Elainellaceae cyanobacterium]
MDQPSDQSIALSQPPKTHVLGVPVHLLDDYGAWLWHRVQQGKPAHVVTLNAEMAMQAEQNSELADMIRRAELVVPDGAGVVLYLRLRNQAIQRCPGIELAESLIRQMGTSSEWRLEDDAEDGPSLFFYGGAPGVTDAVAQRWKAQLPHLKVAGAAHGYISPEEQEALCDRLKREQPAVILVGLGVPRQEFWIDHHRHLCPNSVWIGVGGSFDIWAGTKTRAPGWLRNNNLEWSYRLYKEPWRWRRMLVLPQFAWRSVMTLWR